MRKVKMTLTVLLLVSFFGLLPAWAGAWRSSTGNIFRFQNDGSVSLLQPDGATFRGNWWWFDQPNGVFQYYILGSTKTVKMNGNNHCTVWDPQGRSFQWSRLAGRGAKKDEDKGAASGWLMIREAP